VHGRGRTRGAAGRHCRRATRPGRHCRFAEMRLFSAAIDTSFSSFSSCVVVESLLAA
jgi:hypothetical protein